jgi:hypothetical protein
VRNSRAFKRDAYPEDLIGALVFLASSDSDFITGQTVAKSAAILRNSPLTWITRSLRRGQANMSLAAGPWFPQRRVITNRIFIQWHG